MHYGRAGEILRLSVPLRPYLFLINTYKDGVAVKMYLYVLISTQYVLSCTYFNQKCDQFHKNDVKIVYSLSENLKIFSNYTSVLVIRSYQPLSYIVSSQNYF